MIKIPKNCHGPNKTKTLSIQHLNKDGISQLLSDLLFSFRQGTGEYNNHPLPLETKRVKTKETLEGAVLVTGSHPGLYNVMIWSLAGWGLGDGGGGSRSGAAHQQLHNQHNSAR